MNEAEFHVLALLPDGTAPLSIVLPEARHFGPALRRQSPRVMLDAIQGLHERRFINLWIENPDGMRRDVRAEDFAGLINEYESGARDANVVRQILDRDDLWLGLAPQGREALFADPRART